MLCNIRFIYTVIFSIGIGILSNIMSGWFLIKQDLPIFDIRYIGNSTKKIDNKLITIYEKDEFITYIFDDIQRESPELENFFYNEGITYKHNHNQKFLQNIYYFHSTCSCYKLSIGI